MEKIWDTLTNEELCIEYQKTKNNKLFEYFISRNNRYLMSYAGPIIKKHPEQKDEFIQECKTAMWEAMLKFSPDKKCKFTTYCYYFFKKNIWKHWQSEMLITIPINTMTKQDELVKKHPERIFKTESIHKSIYSSSESAQDVTLEEVIESDDTPVDQLLINQDNKEQLSKILYSLLSAREIKCVKLYFGLEDGICKTQQEIANIYNLSRERIRQIIKRALIKIRKYYSKNNYTIYDF